MARQPQAGGATTALFPPKEKSNAVGRGWTDSSPCPEPASSAQGPRESQREPVTARVACGAGTVLSPTQ